MGTANPKMDAARVEAANRIAEGLQRDDGVDVTVEPVKRTRRVQAPRMTPEDVLIDLERLMDTSFRQIAACTARADKLPTGSNGAMRIERLGSVWVTIRETLTESIQTIDKTIDGLYGLASK